MQHGRLLWIDHLRGFVILLVVTQHACVTYSHIGSWYVMSKVEPPLAQKIPFIIWQVLMQSFFMGLLFFIAAYFAAHAIARRGVASFVHERLVRLGLPTLLYMLVIHPFIVYGLNPWHRDFGAWTSAYAERVTSGRFLSDSGPMWFAFALLLFCLLLAQWRSWRPAQPAVAAGPPPSALLLFLFPLGIGLVSFLVRQVQPLGSSVYNMQLAYFPQYVGAFLAGLAAARYGWLTTLAASPSARRIGRIALICAPLSLLAILLLGLDSTSKSFDTGLHWQAFVLALWEQFAGVGLSLGLFWLFSHKLDRIRPAFAWMVDRSFAVYVLHPPVLVALTMLYRSLPQNPFALAALLTVTGLVASFIVADLARRMPVLRQIL